MLRSSCSSQTADSCQQNTKLKQTILELKEERQELIAKAAIQDKQINELDKRVAIKDKQSKLTHTCTHSCTHTIMK